MDQLIKALQIFLKYANPTYPTHCAHDALIIMGDYDDMTEDDKKALNELGFHWDSEYDGWASYKYGSA